MQMSETYIRLKASASMPKTLPPGSTLIVDAKTFGYPRRSLTDLDAGDYSIQAVFNVYEQFHLASGKNLWLPPDKGEGQQWNHKPGNPYNKPVKDPLRPQIAATIKTHPRPNHSSHRRHRPGPAVIAAAEARRKMAQVHALPQRKAERVLGPRRLSRRMDPACPTDSTNIPTPSIPSSSIRTITTPASAPRPS